MAERTTTYRLRRRTLSAGEVITVTGASGEFSIVHFDVGGPGGDTVTVFGGPPLRGKFRTFVVERIGTRPSVTTIRTPKGPTPQKKASA